VFGEIFNHSFLEVLHPLARYIICKDDAKKGDPEQCRQNYIVHITIPKPSHLLLGANTISKLSNLPLSLLEVTHTVFPNERMSRAKNQPSARDSIARSVTRACPDDSVVLRLTGINLRDTINKEMQ